MAFKTADKIQESSTTTGTGALTLVGATVGHKAFSAICSNGDVCYYSIDGGAEWEVGLGTWSTGNLLTRTTVIASSTGSAVAFSAGSKIVSLTGPASKVLQQDGSGNINLSAAGGGLNLARSSIVQNATTMDLFALSNIIDGTGSAVVLAAIVNATQAGAIRSFYPIAGTTITNNAMFSVDGGANYVTLAGDRVDFEVITTSTYKVHITKALISDKSTNNIVINGGFTINNGNAGTPYVSNATLTVGQYGHEMWKAGASGGDYSFTQLASNTTITIATGKSIIQVIEDKNVQDTSYVVSWIGTAQARFGANTNTPTGTYISSPMLITGQSVGTVMSVEFNTGTLVNVQIEKGATASSYVARIYPQELALTQRYFETLARLEGTVNGSPVGIFRVNWQLKATKRATPTLTFTQTNPASGTTVFDTQVDSVSFVNASTNSLILTNLSANARL
jgi:hypothetical protein